MIQLYSLFYYYDSTLLTLSWFNSTLTPFVTTQPNFFSMNSICMILDLGSGSNVDVTVIQKDKVDVLRNYKKPNERGRKEQSYVFEKGTTCNHLLIILD